MVLGIAILKVIVLHVNERQMVKTLEYFISRSPLLSPDKLAKEPKTRIRDSFYCVCVCVCVRACTPVDCSPPGSSVHGIFLARILEWVAISSSRGSCQPGD